jgi:broad specificity phosphatase PhoE
MIKTLYLVRHAQSVRNVRNHWADGPATIPLSEQGRREAAAFANEWALRPSMLVASTYSRSQETAVPLAAKFDLPLVTRADAREFTFWDYRLTESDHQPLGAKGEEFWKRCDPFEKAGGSNAENFVEFIQRCHSFLSWVEDAPFERCVCFTHGFFMHAIRAIKQDGVALPPKDFMKYLHETLPGRAYANLEVVEYLIESHPNMTKPICESRQ